MASMTTPSFVDKLPLLKLPPDWFSRALEAVIRANGSRTLAAANVLEAFHDKAGLTEKLAMRAFVIPTFTRIHFLRSTPDSLAAAPNGVVWEDLHGEVRDAYVGLCLRDQLILSIGVPAAYSQWSDLRSLATQLGPPYPDRLGGIIRLLRRFPTPSAVLSSPAAALFESSGEVAQISRESASEELERAFESYMRGKRVVGLDSLRVAGITGLRKRKHVVASSFLADAVLLAAMSKGRLCSPFASGTNALGELVLGRRPFGSVLPQDN